MNKTTNQNSFPTSSFKRILGIRNRKLFFFHRASLFSMRSGKEINNGKTKVK